MKVQIKDVIVMVNNAIESLEFTAVSRNESEQMALNGLVSFMDSLTDLPEDALVEMSQVLLILSKDVADPNNDCEGSERYVFSCEPACVKNHLVPDSCCEECDLCRQSASRPKLY